MKLTRRQALIETRKIWRALAKTGAQSKKSVRGVERFINRCPCCQFVTERTGRVPFPLISNGSMLLCPAPAKPPPALSLPGAIRN